MSTTSRFAVCIVILVGLPSAAGAVPDCLDFAQRQDALNLRIAPRSAEDIVVSQIGTINPRTGTPMTAERTQYVGAAWTAGSLGGVARLVYANGDVLWSAAITHSNVFVGADGSAWVRSFGAFGTGGVQGEICNTLPSADLSFSAKPGKLSESLCRYELAYTADDGSVYAISLIGDAACEVP